MHWRGGAALAAAVSLAGAFLGAGPAGANIVVAINKSTQRMAVLVDGKERYTWKVSTGTGGGPPSGSYRPERLERKWFSHKYNWSPMPHAIFFHEGYAIHGTLYVSRLGQRASHGCVRLHPKDAATLFDLVRGRGMGGTTIVVSNSDYAAKSTLPRGPKAAESSQVKAAGLPKPKAAEPRNAKPASEPTPARTGSLPAAPKAPPAFEE